LGTARRWCLLVELLRPAALPMSGCRLSMTRPRLRLLFLAISVFRNDLNGWIQVREYFNSEGFNRWNKIYSEVDDVNFVQKFIRQGHQQTIDKVKSSFYNSSVSKFRQ
jgi:hypothetical protein